MDKIKDYIYEDNKELIKNHLDDGLGYNFDKKKKREIKSDYSKIYRFINKEFIRNNKLR